MTPEDSGDGRELLRALRRPSNTPPRAQRLIGNVWLRLLVSYRSTAAEAGHTASPSFLTKALRATLLSLAEAYGHVMRRFPAPHAFLPTDHIEWVGHLESHWHVIREELEELRRRFELPALIHMMPGEQCVVDARWKMFILRYFGRSIVPNCARCPRTAALLERIPGLVSANFSVLQPGTRIAPHHGIFSGMLRYHLALIVPERTDLCGLRVGNETRHWQAGSSLLFDETRQHEAWNLTDEDRAVLLLDVKRQLPSPLRWLNETVLVLLSRLVMLPLARVNRMLPQTAPDDAIQLRAKAP